MSNKIDYLERLLNDKNYDIAVFTEHGCKSEEINTFPLDNYVLADSFCRSNRKSGGVSIYCNLNIKYEKLAWVNNHSKELDFETAGILIHSSAKRDIFVAGVYRQPKGDFDTFIEQLEILLSKATSKYSNLIIAGDLNIDWFTQNKSLNIFKDTIETFGLKSVIQEPTRVTETSKTLLDYIITNIPDEMCSSRVIENFVSDHRGQELEIYSISSPIINNPLKEFRRNLSKINLNTFIIELLKIDWNELKHIKDTNEAWNHFCDEFYNCFNMVCPLKEYKIKPTQTTNKIKLSDLCLRKKQLMIEAFNSYKATSMKIFKEKYKKCKIDYYNEIKKCKSQYYEQKIIGSNNLSREIWKISKEMSGLANSKRTMSENVCIYSVENNILNDPTEVASAFNDYFINSTSQGAISNNKTDASNLQNISDIVHNESNSVKVLCDKSVFLKPTSEQEISSIILNMKNKHSHGWDGISPWVLKQCYGPVLKALTELINGCLLEGIFPDVLKLSVIKPLFKKGDKLQMKNYRPIALISTFCKILEYVIYYRIIEFIDKNGLISKTQFGFRRGLSTINAIVEFCETLLNSLDEGKCTTGTFIDLSKAFDTVDHRVLLHKIEMYGIRGKALDLMKSYLTNRWQITEICSIRKNNCLKFQSTPALVQHGVPQGSILGPLLFILYVNDIPKLQNCLTISYADDTSLLTFDSHIEDTIRKAQNNLDNIIQYFSDNKLTVNPLKTSYIIFNKKRNYNLEYHTNLTCNGENISNVPSIKFLGITLDKGLTWEQHINEICMKINKNSFVLKRVSGYLSIDYKKILYYGLFYSHLSYGIEIWGGAAKLYIERLFKIQKKALRYIFGFKQRESCRGIFLEHNMLTIYGLYIFKVIMLIKNNSQKVVIGNTVHSYRTRGMNNYFRSRVNKQFAENDPFKKGVIFYNRLPDHIKNLTDASFKTVLKRYLAAKVLYSLDEF